MSNPHRLKRYAFSNRLQRKTDVDIAGALRVHLVATATDELGNSSQLSLPASTVVT